MTGIRHGMLIATFGLVAATGAQAAGPPIPTMHPAGASGHSTGASIAGSRASYTAGPAVHSASFAVATRAAAHTSNNARAAQPVTTLSYPYPFQYPYIPPASQLQWADHLGICVGGPYQLDGECMRSAKAVTTEGLFDTSS